MRELFLSPSLALPQWLCVKAILWTSEDVVGWNVMGLETRGNGM